MSHRGKKTMSMTQVGLCLSYLMLWRVQAFNIFARQMQLSLLTRQCMIRTRLSHLPVDLTKALNCVVFTPLAVVACSEFPKMMDMQERSVEEGEGGCLYH